MADQNFIEKIRAAEAEANQLRVEAREAAAEKRKEARLEADRFVDQAYKDAQLERQRIMEQAEAEYRDILAAVSHETDEIKGEASSDAISQAADIAAERIVTLRGDF